MSLDYDLFVIDSTNQNTTDFQLRDCIKDAIERLRDENEGLRKCVEELTAMVKSLQKEEVDEEKYKILANKAKCRKCGDIIESRSVHDYVHCKCGAISVDGGLDYLKRGGSPEYFDDMSIVVKDSSSL